MKAVIIAGGLGTRLRPLTDNTPKPIVPIANRPFIVHQIEQLARHGVTEVIINLHYLSQEIQKLLGEGERLGVKIYYSIEEEPLGTAGAVKNAEQFFDDQPMVVCNGDVITDLNISKLVDYHRQKQAEITIALKEVSDPMAFGLVVMDRGGRVKEFIEKPGNWGMVRAKTINAGTYIVNPRVFQQVPKGKHFMFERDLFPSLVAAGAPIYGYVSNCYWIDIGSPAKYKEAHQAILRGEVAVKIDGTRIEKEIWLGQDARLDPSVKLFGRSIIGEKVEIGAQTEIRDYVVLGERVVVGANCSLDRAIVWSGTRLGDHVVLSDCIIGRDCRLEDGVVIERDVVLADGSAVKKDSRIAS